MEMNSAWNEWKDIFLNIVDKHGPRRVMRVKNKPAPWLNSQLKEEMYERDWLKKKASETQWPDVWKAYKTKKLTVNKKVKKTKKDYYKHQIEGASGNLKATWKILNDLMGKKPDSTRIKIAEYSNSRIFTLQTLGRNLHLKSHRKLAIARFLVAAVRKNIGGLLSWLVSLSSSVPDHELTRHGLERGLHVSFLAIFTLVESV